MQMTDPYTGSRGLSKRNVNRISPIMPYRPASDTAAGAVVSTGELCYVGFSDRTNSRNSDGGPQKLRCKAAMRNPQCPRNTPNAHCITR